MPPFIVVVVYNYRIAYFVEVFLYQLAQQVKLLYVYALGVMLPLGIKWFQKFWKTYLAGFGGSLLIEIFQLVCDKGMFECDDILGNTIGTMIGYGLFAGILAIINMQQMKRKRYRNTK